MIKIPRKIHKKKFEGGLRALDRVRGSDSADRVGILTFSMAVGILAILLCTSLITSKFSLETRYVQNVSFKKISLIVRLL